LTGNGFPDLVDVDQSGLYSNSFSPENVDVYHNNHIFGADFQGGLGNPSSFRAGDTPDSGGYDVALGDFDGRHYVNGKPILDLAVAGNFGVSILMNDGPDFNGNPTFGSPQDYGGGGFYVTVGDFTGNGKTDLLQTGGEPPIVLLGNGDGTFQTYQKISTDESWAGQAVVGDFDGRHYANGLPILDFATTGGLGVNVYMNKGGSTLAFLPPVSYAAGLNPSSLTVGDFRGDGKLDLAVANQDSNNVSVLLGNGDGKFQPAVNYAVGSDPLSIGVGDFNGDGKLDLAVANDGSGNVSVLQGTGKGTFLKAQNFAEVFPSPNSSNIAPTGGTDYYALAVADFGGTGYSGVAVASFLDGQISVMEGVGTSLFQPAVQLPVGYARGGVATGDFNGDGKADIAFSSVLDHVGITGPVQVFPGNGDGTFSSPINSSVTLADLPAVGDFNGDGKLDLVTTSDPYNEVGELNVLLGNGDGTFRSSCSLDFGDNVRSVAVGDFNGDGKLDLAVSLGGNTHENFDARVAIYMGNGDGTFGILQNGTYIPNQTYDLGQGIPLVRVGDFNGDGKLDLVVNGILTVSVNKTEVEGYRVLLGNGDGTFQSPVSGGSVGSWVAVGNFDGRHYANGQPILDLVTTVGNGVNVSLGNGDGTFQNPVFYPLPASMVMQNSPISFPISPLAVGDFNGDGNLDIAVLCGTADTSYVVCMLLGNGDGTFQGPYVDLAGGDQIAAADFTGDGRSGIVTNTGNLLLPYPRHMSLDNASVAEHQPVGTLVGTFSTATDDPNNFFTYQLVRGTGGADNADFSIDAQGHLHTAASFDYATRSSYSIRVRSTDIVGDISEQVFTIKVTPMIATIQVTGYGVPYDGNPHTATGTATGQGGVDLSTYLTLTGATHTAAGTYTDTWTFHDRTGVYEDAHGTVSDTISRVNAILSITGASVPYDGKAHPATATATGVESSSPANLTSALHLFYSTDGGNTFSSSAPVNVGTYEIYYTFDGNANYNAVSTRTDSGQAIVLSPVNAGVQVTGYSVPYDGHSHTASSSATDVNGNALPASDFNLTATTHTAAGSSSDSWTFHDPSGNYQDASGTVSDSISPVALTITASNAAKVYGTLETFSSTAFTETGLVNGDTITGVTETSTGAPASVAVGTYDIVPSAATGTGLGNYTITYVNGTLTVTPAPVSAGIFTWTGVTSGDWFVASNWSTEAVPGPADTAVIKGASFSPVLSVDTTVGGLVVNSGSLTLFANLTDSGIFRQTGGFVLLGPSQLQVAGDVTRTGGTMTSTTGTLVLDGTAGQKLTDTSFTHVPNLVISNTSAAGVTLPGGSNVSTSSVTLNAGSTLTLLQGAAAAFLFDSGTFTDNGKIVLSQLSPNGGNVTALIKVRGLMDFGTGNTFDLSIFPAAANAVYTFVTYGSLTGEQGAVTLHGNLPFDAYAGAGTGALTVSLNSLGTTDTWLGGADRDFANPANWSTGAVPSPNDRAVIRNAPFDPILSANAALGSLQVSGGFLTLDAVLTVTGTYSQSAGFLAFGADADQLRIAGDVTRTGGVFLGTAGTVVFNGAAQSVRDTSGHSFGWNFVVNSGTTVTVQQGSVVSVGNDFTNNGTVNMSMAVPSSAPPLVIGHNLVEGPGSVFNLTLGNPSAGLVYIFLTFGGSEISGATFNANAGTVHHNGNNISVAT
jgi:hypothetical protein